LSAGNPGEDVQDISGATPRRAHEPCCSSFNGLGKGDIPVFPERERATRGLLDRVHIFARIHARGGLKVFDKLRLYLTTPIGAPCR